RLPPKTAARTGRGRLSEEGRRWVRLDGQGPEGLSLVTARHSHNTYRLSRLGYIASVHNDGGTMPDRPREQPDPVAVLDGLDPDVIRAELSQLERRADALRVLLRAQRFHATARRRRGEAARAS